MDVERVSALGTWRYARDFLEGASKIQSPPNGPMEELQFRHNAVAYFLVGHSIELSLKAFLICRGMCAKELSRRPYGHDLKHLRKEASRRKLGTEVKLSRREKSVVDFFSHTYASKSYEYFSRGLMQLPRYSELHAIATKLIQELRHSCMRFQQAS